MIVTPSIQFSSCDSQKFISIPSIHWSGFPTWNRTATPPGSFGVDWALGSVQDFQSNAQAFHITFLHCQNFQLITNFIQLGLIMFGERVITTMGSKITPMTPSLGFVVVISSNFVLMLCTLMGIPTSTTQCQVISCALQIIVPFITHVISSDLNCYITSSV